MATKLNQIIAVEAGVKADTSRALTKAHREVQKAPQLTGIARVYQPRDEDGDQFPPESTRVQVNAESVMYEVSQVLGRYFDITALKDWTNCEARSDVVLGGVTLIANVPVPYLLFLEKQLVDLHTFVEKLPVLDPSEMWHRDESTDTWATDPTRTNRTKKVYRNHVKAEATREHPAQVDVYTEDVVVGQWTTTKFSGALPAKRVNDLLDRVDQLRTAVKFARESANNTEVVDRLDIGHAVFGFLFYS